MSTFVTTGLRCVFFMFTCNYVHFVYTTVLLSRVRKMFPIFFTMDHNDRLFLRVSPSVPYVPMLITRKGLKAPQVLMFTVVAGVHITHVFSSIQDFSGIRYVEISIACVYLSNNTCKDN